MDIYELNKVMSHPTKARIIVHFATCSCCQYSVSCLVDKFCAKQANISKHLADLRSKNIIQQKRRKHEVFYSINQKWLGQYAKLMQILVTEPENRAFVCKCNKGKIVA